MNLSGMLLLIAASASTTANAADKDLQAFVEKAAQLNQYQIEGGQLASERAVATSNRSYAKDALEFSSETQSDLATAATAEGAKLPTSLDDEGAEKPSSVRNAPAHDFDAAYLSGQFDPRCSGASV